jgi:hypothetical protein
MAKISGKKKAVFANRLESIRKDITQLSAIKLLELQKLG